MGRRARTGHDDGLELLLDTICNTFGGIVFMALLVCLMTQNTRSKVSSAAETDKQLAELHSVRLAQSRLIDVRRERETLERTHAQQVKLLRAMQAGSSRAETEAVVRLTLEQQQARLELQKSEDELASATRAAGELREKVKTLEAAVAEGQRAAETAARRYQEQKEQQTVRLRLPLARATTKKQAGFVLRDKKLRQIHEYDSSGDVVGFHRTDLLAGRIADQISPADFAPAGGILMDGSPASLAVLTDRLVPLSKTRHYVAIALWPDSYAEFRLLRDHLIKLGFEYELILVGDENAISLGSGGGGRVQ